MMIVIESGYKCSRQLKLDTHTKKESEKAITKETGDYWLQNRMPET